MSATGTGGYAKHLGRLINSQNWLTYYIIAFVKGEVPMIAVVFPNGRQAQVTAEELDELIEKKVIVSFRRATGWAVLGPDPIRAGRPALCIPERRSSAYQKFDSYLKTLTA